MSDSKPSLPDGASAAAHAQAETGYDVVGELQRLETLRDPAAEQPDRSNRVAERYPVREEAVLFPMSRRNLNDAGQTVFLRDISRGGVGFLSDRALPSGQDYRIVFQAGGYPIGEYGVTVRYCRPVRPGLFLIGTSFVATAGLLTTLGVDAGRLEAEDRQEESFDAYREQDAA